MAVYQAGRHRGLAVLVRSYRSLVYCATAWCQQPIKGIVFVV
jgi:hypothetical protein